MNTHTYCRYTLGGFFLANYSESPFGPFDELVAIAGIVWNPPTSHAWAARVYVNSDNACTHGRKVFKHMIKQWRSLRFPIGGGGVENVYTQKFL
ncbi:putative protein NEOXANTHIN-DEFICIENT 1 [Helianthus annuus]|nr:putative protein NEOXANTHIN-DEFICIENT 1 [Helianthus annuus]